MTIQYSFDNSLGNTTFIKTICEKSKRNNFESRRITLLLSFLSLSMTKTLNVSFTKDWKQNLWSELKKKISYFTHICFSFYEWMNYNVLYDIAKLGDKFECWYFICNKWFFKQHLKRVITHYFFNIQGDQRISIHLKD